MSHLRTEKEKELFQQFQSQQQRMADLLQSQRQQERNTEDETIARAMEEQYAKKEVHVYSTAEFLEVAMVYATSPNDQQAEQEKQRQFMERTRDIQKHRIEMMAEKERQQREEQQANQDTLKQKRAHDLKVSFLYCPSILPSPASVLAVPPGPAGEGTTSTPGSHRAPAVSPEADGREGREEGNGEEGRDGGQHAQ